MNPALATDSAFIIAGLVLLYFGAQLLVKGSEQLGYKLGFDTLVVGITFVAFGTSAPELAITLDAVITGNPDLAVANIIGSNLANICLVVGLTTFLGTVSLPSSVVFRDMVFMLLAFIVLSIFLADSSLNRLEGLALFLGLVFYLGYRIIRSKHNGEQVEKHARELSYSWCLVYVFLGACMLGLGGDVLVTGASDMALHLGVSQTTIGLTVVAMGSSLPEIAASLYAARIGRGGIALGNVIGSNIWNSLGVLGIGAMFAPIRSSSLELHMLAAMLGAGILLWLLLHTGSGLRARQGFLLIGGYLAYLAFTL